jgi:hypothetical protein
LVDGFADGAPVVDLLALAPKPERLEAEARGGPGLFNGQAQAGFDRLPKRKTPSGAVLTGGAKEGIGNLDGGPGHANGLSETLRDIIESA